MGRFGDTVRRTLGAPLRLLMPKNPWLRLLVYALPVVLLLALFGPAVDVLLKLLDLGVRILEPLLQTTIGRLLLLGVVFAAGGVTAVWLLRSRVQNLRAEAVLGRHLAAVGALVGNERHRLKERFRKVARYRGPLPERYPHVVQDANLKLARWHLEHGDADQALAWLLRLVEPELPPELRRSARQLRIRALRQQGVILPAQLRKEVAAAVAEFPDDYTLLGEWRDLLAAEGPGEALAQAAEQVAKAAPPAHLARERQRWFDELQRAGQSALAAGDHDAARRLAKRLEKAAPDDPAGGLLLGDVQRSLGEVRGALRTYGATRSAGGLERMAEVLAAHPGVAEPRELLEWCPLQGMLLLVARELARAGESERAERAARIAAEVLGPTATVCAVLADVLALLGKPAEARRLQEQTVTRLLGEPPPG